ncbi:heparinase II/III domain-containing protein [Cyclobacterium jeungdonense]|uniref:Heparinase II/III family protein n=1 Tax=Cyclobacterium jeungdonense TaxID=708087 RepID=A0ABT8C3U2_9BACT|nr:heparinase II/III family protein [Cyclobacterium jeungdonense]MDN3687371.1 heparinase II/III family protein [Cyclobacterium jeungdonense]
MKNPKLLLLLVLFAGLLTGPVPAVEAANGSIVRLEQDPPKLENPITVSYIKRNLRKSSPKLALTPAWERNLKREIKQDPMVANYYEAVKANAESVLGEPVLTRNMVGRRLLGTSRDMLHRMNVLGITYRIDGDQKYLDKMNEELLAVSNFSDWNPSHFLDVAEMATAVALAIDWVGKDLPNETVDLAKKALIEKGIQPSWEGNHGWINGTNNWNQVCNGGMIAASIMIADQDPELAAKTISRSLDGMPHALAEYGPDGVYPEGSTYWGYGTAFSVLTSAMLESAFGTDFGIAEYPAFKASADFRKLSIAPSGWYYNYADCGDRHSEAGDIILAWFGTETGNPLYIEKQKFLQPAAEMGKLHRIAGAGLVWLAQFEATSEEGLPTAWKGDGSNPIAIFRDDSDSPNAYYFGGKGGKATISHGNMDAGSFIWEINGVRWVIDPGNQPYNELETTGFDLWGRCQDCERWTLLTKNNYGHSTLTVNGELHVNEGFASLENFSEGPQPEALFDLTPVFGGDLDKAHRKFVRPDDRSLLIEDQLVINENTEMITWQLMTQAEVEIVPGGAILTQDGKQVKLENLSHPDLMVSVVSLDPAPLALDRQIDGLKRIEIRIPAWVLEKETTLKVKLEAL